MERVFEINRNFRNEGADSTHSPEFAMLEFYQAYADYIEMASITRELIQEAAFAVFGSHTATHLDGTELDLSGVWPMVSLYGALSEAVGEDVTPQTLRTRLIELAKAVDIEVGSTWVNGKIVEELFEHHVITGFGGRPTFVIDFPVDTSPLTRDHRTEVGKVEKWDLYINGYEQATGYSELLMTLTGLGIRETILFPLVKPERL